MNVNGSAMRTIRLLDGDKPGIEIIDQRKLPHQLKHVVLHTVAETANAIEDMYVRGAPLIGATAGLGMYIAVCQCIREFEGRDSTDDFHAALIRYSEQLRATRPTAVNLMWAIDQQLAVAQRSATLEQIRADTRAKALEIIENDVEQCRMIGVHGLELIREIARKKAGETVNILTHCNAGWLATVDWGTATSPMYHAFEAGIDVHIWVDETRPRNQGAKLTAWELGKHGIKHTVISDNTGGHLMQHGMVDMVLVGSDRTVRSGDVANKIGTYLKALAAKDNDIPFYVALPSTTLDMTITDGVRDIPVEQRSADEVTTMDGMICETGEPRLGAVLIPPADSPACNYAFDVTPARLVTSLITERGICPANEASISSMFADLIS